MLKQRSLMGDVVRGLAVLSLLCTMACGDDGDSEEVVAGDGGTGGGAGSAVSSGGTAGSSGGGTTGGSAGTTGAGGAGTAGSGSGGTSGSTVDGLYFIGRFDRTDPAAPIMSWSGSAISVRFEGTSVSVELDDGGQNLFYVIVDGVVQPTKLAPDPGRGTYVLAEGLTAGEHEVTIHKLTEPGSFGDTQFFGFTFPDGQMVPWGPALGRRIEVIGDSITCGYGIEGPDRNCPFSADTENQYLTYAAIAARNLGAELHSIAWSGKGVFSNRGSTIDPMPDMWLRTLAQTAGSVWDFTSWQPDAVVINLGTNDLAETNLDQAPFPTEYLAFVREVRSVYPSAHIVTTVGPLLSDMWPTGAETLTRARDAAQGAATTLNGEGDAAISFVEFAQETTSYGCDWHPNIARNEIMAGELEAELRSALGW